MKTNQTTRTLGLALLALSVASLATAQDGGGRRPGGRNGQRLGAGLRPGGDIPANGKRLEIEAGGLKRTALVFLPKNDRRQKPPLLIAFHGHGGNGTVFARNSGFPGAWPEAIMVFPDGLTGVPDDRDTKGEKPGWQKSLGTMEDRDLALFDAIVEKAVAEHNADPEHVYVAGFSNGGRMSYLLWSARADKIRAIADCASQSIKDELARTFSPKPALVIHGKADQRVDQKAGMLDINAVLQANHSTETMTSWPDGTTRKHYAIGKGGADTLVLTHPGPHEWPKFATPEAVAFFKTHR